LEQSKSTPETVRQEKEVIKKPTRLVEWVFFVVVGNVLKEPFKSLLNYIHCYFFIDKPFNYSYRSKYKINNTPKD
jgi:hypothetical protein